MKKRYGWFVGVAMVVVVAWAQDVVVDEGELRTESVRLRDEEGLLVAETGELTNADSPRRAPVDVVGDGVVIVNLGTVASANLRPAIAAQDSRDLRVMNNGDLISETGAIRAGRRTFVLNGEDGRISGITVGRNSVVLNEGLVFGLGAAIRVTDDPGVNRVAGEIGNRGIIFGLGNAIEVGREDAANGLLLLENLDNGKIISLGGSAVVSHGDALVGNRGLIFALGGHGIQATGGQGTGTEIYNEGIVIGLSRDLPGDVADDPDLLVAGIATDGGFIGNSEDGIIGGRAFGIRSDRGDRGASVETEIENRGIIVGGYYGGILLTGNHDDRIVNSGIISGRYDVVHMGRGDDVFRMEGGLVRSRLEAGDTAVILDGDIELDSGVAIDLGPGRDRLVLSGGIVDGIIDGGRGDDVITVRAGESTPVIGDVTNVERLNLRDGSLASDGHWDIDVVRIRPAGTLIGNPTITGNLRNRGTLDPSSAVSGARDAGTPARIGEVTVEGNYVHGANATLAVDVAGDKDSDRVTVGGAANLRGGTVDVHGSRTLSPAIGTRRYDILTAGDGVNGQFDQLTTDAPADGVLSFSLDYSPDAVTLVGTRESYSARASSPAGTAIGNALADALRSGTPAMQAILTELDSMNGKTLGNTLKGLSPTPSLAFGRLGVELRNLFGAILEGRQGEYGNMVAALDTARSGPHAGDVRTPSSLGELDGWAVWARTSAIAADQEADDLTGVGYNYDTRTSSFGVDRLFDDQVMLGASFSLGTTDVDWQGTAANGDISASEIGVYGTWFADQWTVDAQFSGGWTGYTIYRDITVGAVTNTATADYAGTQYGGQVTAGYSHDLANGLRLIPTGGCRYVRIDEDGYAETGAGALNLTVNGRRTESFSSILGARLTGTWTLAGMDVVPEARAFWLHEFGDTTAGTTAQFAGGGSPFAIQGADMDRNTGVVGVGTEVRLDERTSLFVNYDVHSRNDFVAHTGSIGLRFVF